MTSEAMWWYKERDDPTDSHPVIPSEDYGKLNFTNAKFSSFSEIWVVAPPVEVAAKATALAILVFVAFVANGVVIVTIGSTKELRRSPLNLFVLNLAIADILNVSYSSWAVLLYDIYQNYVLGPVLCQLDSFFETACMLASVFSLVAISIDRLVGIVFPFLVPRMTKKFAIIAILIIWIAAAGLSLPPVFYREYKERQWVDYLETWCQEDKAKLQVYWLIFLVVLVWLPLLSMTVAYGFIICKIERYDDVIAQSHNIKQIVYRKKVIKMLCAIIIIFLICWLPFTVLIIYRHFHPDNLQMPKWYQITFFIAHFFALCNCCVNPFIYGAGNNNFRKVFRRKFGCCFRKKKDISRTPTSVSFIYSNNNNNSIKL